MEATPYFLTNDESSGDSVLTLSGSGFATVPITNDSSGIVEVISLGAQATSMSFTVNIRDSRLGRSLSNRPLHADTIFGQSGRQFMLPSSLFLGKNQAFHLEVQDLSGSTNSIRFFLQGNKYYEDLDIPKPFPVFYTTDASVSLSALGSTTAYVSVNQGYSFFLDRILVKSTGAFKFKITNTRTGKSWQNGYLHSDSLGSAQYNKIFPPQLLENNTKLRIDITDLSGSTNAIYWNFSGVHR